MIDHISLPVSDYARSRAFYDKALGALGYKVAMEITDSPGLRRRRLRPGRAAGARVLDRRRAVSRVRRRYTPDGQHIAFQAPSRAAVDAFHAAALAGGGRDNGLPGLRPHYHPNYYAAFVLDPDGHRLEAVCHLPEQQA